ncbi:MAG: hypothetical protein P8Z73_00475 [Desulfobacteraceae bacterium]
MLTRMLISVVTFLTLFWFCPGGMVYGAQFNTRPVSLTPTRVIPSQNVVKEVGGIQYGRHHDITLSDQTVTRAK